MIFSFWAALLFYLLPLLAGLIFTKKIFLAWITGALVWFLIFAITFYSLEVFHLTILFPRIIQFLAVCISTISILLLFNYLYSRFSLKPVRKHLASVAIILVLVGFSIPFFFVSWSKLSPYPYSVNWDIYEHITAAYQITQNNFSFLPSYLSDTFTFDGYTTLFHTLLALPSIALNSNLLGTYWWLEYFYFVLVLIATFLLSKKVFHNNFAAILAVIFSGLVFESSIVYSPFFFIPQTFTALITILVLIDLQSIQKYKPKLIFLTISTLTLLLMHFVMGPIGILILFLFVPLYGNTFCCSNLLRALPKLSILKKINPNAYILGSIVILLLSILSNFLGSWALLPREEATHFQLSLTQKWELLYSWYGITLPVYGILGVIWFFKSDNLLDKKVLLVSLLLLSLSLAPFSYFMKFYVFTHYFMSILLAAGVFALIFSLPKIIKIGSILLVGFSLLLVSFNNQSYYLAPLYFSGKMSHFSTDELNASYWLKQHFSKDTLIISDPATQNILEALSTVNTQGGAYSSVSTRQSLSLINTSYNPQTIVNNLLRINDRIPSIAEKRKKVLFVVGGRYFAWQRLPDDQKLSFFYNIWTPQQTQPYDYPYIHFLSLYFKEVYSNSSITIFKIQ